MLSSLLSRGLRGYSLEVGCQTTLGTFGTVAAPKLLDHTAPKHQNPQAVGQKLQLLRRVLANSQGGGRGRPGAHGDRSQLCSLLQAPGLIQLILSTGELIEMPELSQTTNSGQIKAIDPDLSRFWRAFLSP